MLSEKRGNTVFPFFTLCFSPHQPASFLPPKASQILPLLSRKTFIKGYGIIKHSALPLGLKRLKPSLRRPKKGHGLVILLRSIRKDA
jgi:hypothetical protein